MGDALELTVVMVAVVGAAVWALRRVRANMLSKSSGPSCASGACEGCGVMSGCEKMPAKAKR
jgi:hypothetical protein